MKPEQHMMNQSPHTMEQDHIQSSHPVDSLVRIGGELKMNISEVKKNGIK